LALLTFRRSRLIFIASDVHLCHIIDFIGNRVFERGHTICDIASVKFSIGKSEVSGVIGISDCCIYLRIAVGPTLGNKGLNNLSFFKDLLRYTFKMTERAEVVNFINVFIW
jgi:hypothetical protein